MKRAKTGSETRPNGSTPAQSRGLTRLGLVAVVALAGMMGATEVSAQITPNRKLSASRDRFVTLEEQLINRLKATAADQQAFIRFVVEQVRQGRLEAGLVVAVERYAIRRNRGFPFPFFERAMRFEAAKRNVLLPPVRQFATTKTRPIL